MGHEQAWPEVPQIYYTVEFELIFGVSLFSCNPTTPRYVMPDVVATHSLRS